MRRNYFVSQKQNGLVVLLFTLSLLVLLGFAALSIDVSHVVLNKSRVQNGVDSAALSAAVAIDRGQSQSEAVTKALNTLSAMSAAQGNGELNFDEVGAKTTSTNTTQIVFPDSSTVAISFSDDPTVFPNSNSLANAEDIYVRVAINNMPLESYLIQLFGINKTVSASAVSGKSSGIIKTGNLVPVGICDANPDDPNDLGLISGDKYTLKIATHDDDFGSGNYHLLDFGSGGATIREALAGKAYDLDIMIGGTVDTETGNTVGPVKQGFNSRWTGDCNGCEGTYAADTDLREDITYSEYIGNTRRLMTVPVLDCKNKIDKTGGKLEMTITGFACFFATEKSTGFDLVGEFIKSCPVVNASTGTDSTSNGLYKIQLYKDPLAEDS